MVFSLFFLIQDAFRKVLSFFVRCLFWTAKAETAGGTFRDAGRFEAFVNSVHAQVAFIHFSGVTVPLGDTPGAGSHTCFATYAVCSINKDDTVLVSALHGTCGAGIYTPWFFTVETGHVYKIEHRKIVLHCRANLDHLAEEGALRAIVFGFTVDLAGLAANALFNILGYIIFAHFQFSSLHGCQLNSHKGFIKSQATACMIPIF